MRGQVAQSVFGFKLSQEYFYANPDALIDGYLAEFKEATLNTLGKRIAQAYKQADRLVIKLKENVTQSFLQKRIDGYKAGIKLDMNYYNRL